MNGTDERGSVGGSGAARTRLVGVVLTLAETVVATLLVFVLLQTFVGRTFAVEQTSMQPTLEPAQRLIVDRLTPRFDPYKVGDIVVFDAPAPLPQEPPLIKRVIAIEGSVVELEGGRVYVDGVALDEPYVFGSEPTEPTTGVSSWVVAPGQLFVLGDHRAVSGDSRAFGPIEVSSVIGRAWLRFFPFDEAAMLTTDGKGQ
jgi:signal peptidase I